MTSDINQRIDRQLTLHRLRAQLTQMALDRDAELDAQRKTFESSTSWLITAPLRLVVGVIRRLIRPSGSGRNPPSAVAPSFLPFEAPVGYRADLYATIRGIPVAEANADIEMRANERGREVAHQTIHDYLHRRLAQFLASGAVLDFTKGSEGASHEADANVTVVIVARDQPELLLDTVSALFETARSVRVVICDMNSGPDTRRLIDRFQGIEVITHRKDLGFVAAVNGGMKRVKTPYALLLNSEARVQAGAVAHARHVLSSDSDVGLVVAKIISPSGVIHEAGSHVDARGDVHRYLQGFPPEAGAANYRRDVDCGSSAFMMVRTKLFRDIGGFTPGPASTSYEGVDLCFRIWNSGYRVSYVPRSVIELREFESSGVHDDAAKLASQNRSRFRSLFLSSLESRREINEDSRFADHYALAHCREPRIRGILYIDFQLPDDRKGAGFPRAREIVRSLALRGMRVVVLPLREASGLVWQEIASGFPESVRAHPEISPDSLAAFMELARDSYDTIWVSRRGTMELLNRIKAEHPELLNGVKVVYDAEALVALRPLSLAARRDLSRPGIDLTSLSSPDTETTVQALLEEIRLTEGADSVVTVNPIEAAIFRNGGCPSVEIVSMPGFIDTVTAQVGDLNGRSSLLFIGRLLEENSPNVDSMDWFMQKVFPLLPKNMKEIHIVGPIRDDFRDLYERLGATVHGRIDDVTDFYNRARVFIAPTRFAAGIPIKVIETASHGLPFVTTPILAQQLGWQSESFCRTATTPSQFARAIVELGEDDKLWHKTRTEMLASVRRDFGDESFNRAIDRVIGTRSGD